MTFKLSSCIGGSNGNDNTFLQVCRQYVVDHKQLPAATGRVPASKELKVAVATRAVLLERENKKPFSTNRHGCSSWAIHACLSFLADKPTNDATQDQLSFPWTTLVNAKLFQTELKKALQAVKKETDDAADVQYKALTKQAQARGSLRDAGPLEVQAEDGAGPHLPDKKEFAKLLDPLSAADFAVLHAGLTNEHDMAALSIVNAKMGKSAKDMDKRQLAEHRAKIYREVARFANGDFDAQLEDSPLVNKYMTVFGDINAADRKGDFTWQQVYAYWHSQRECHSLILPLFNKSGSGCSDETVVEVEEYSEGCQACLRHLLDKLEELEELPSGDQAVKEWREMAEEAVENALAVSPKALAAFFRTVKGYGYDVEGCEFETEEADSTSYGTVAADLETFLQTIYERESAAVSSSAAASAIDELNLADFENCDMDKTVLLTVDNNDDMFNFCPSAAWHKGLFNNIPKVLIYSFHLTLVRTNRYDTFTKKAPPSVSATSERPPAKASGARTKTSSSVKPVTSVSPKTSPLAGLNQAKRKELVDSAMYEFMGAMTRNVDANSVESNDHDLALAMARGHDVEGGVNDPKNPWKRRKVASRSSSAPRAGRQLDPADIMRQVQHFRSELAQKGLKRSRKKKYEMIIDKLNDQLMAIVSASCPSGNEESDFEMSTDDELDLDGGAVAPSPSPKRRKKVPSANAAAKKVVSPSAEVAVVPAAAAACSAADCHGVPDEAAAAQAAQGAATQVAPREARWCLGSSPGRRFTIARGSASKFCKDCRLLCTGNAHGGVPGLHRGAVMSKRPPKLADF